jgi:ABC-type lipoprotein release transport system permease subunit
MALAVIGLVLGLSAALALTRAVKSFLFEVAPTDPFTFLAVAGVLTAAAFVACYFPARRAMRVNPVVALRME